MVAVFREAWRVLRDDGTLWLNLGDSYATGAGKAINPGGGAGSLPQPGVPGYKGRGALTSNGRPHGGNLLGPAFQPNRMPIEGLKPKDLVGIPWRVAFALQADGWYLRSDIIWHKPNPMPESVADRPTKSHEYLFLMSKSERYFFDQDAVRVPAVQERTAAYNGNRRHDDLERRGLTNGTGNPSCTHPGGANLRTVWSIPTESFPGAHFATFPRRLVEPCIRAGSSSRGCCPVCGAPWVREVDHQSITTRPGRRCKDGTDEVWGDQKRFRRIGLNTTTGWRPSCPCDAGEPIPATVLDPFAGSATTLVVAEALGRRGVGCDLSRDYLNLAALRLSRPHAHVPRPSRDESFPLFP